MADERYEELLVQELAAYQERLEAGDTDAGIVTLDSDVPPEIEERIADRKRCLALLHSVRPALGAADGRPANDHAAYRSNGRFERLEQLGSGGFGIVWRARDPVTERFVALKVPRPEVLLSPELRQRFEHEAQAAARLDHPNIVAVLEAGSDGLVPYIASAYYDAATLAEYLREHPGGLASRMAARLVVALAGALEHAHERGVLHRDVKPSNVLLVPRSPASHKDALQFEPKLMDFGLAKLAEGPASELTRSGALLGTLAYMAPEQAAGRSGDITAATDIYALGVVLYELLTGRTPFAGASDLETMRHVLETEPPSIASLRRDVPRELAVICHKCLNKQPSRRYRSARELREDLDRYLAGKPILARPTGTGERLAKWCRRNPQWAALLGVGGAAIFVLIGVLAWSNVKVAAALATARQEREQARLYAYGADMRLAQENWDQGLPAESLALLQKHRPSEGDRDLRGVEWRYLWSANHRDSRVVARQPSPVWSMALSPSGRLLATGDRQGMVRLWQLDPSRPLGEWQAHGPDDIDALVFSGDERTLISAGNDHTIRYWEVPSGQCRFVIDKHKNWIGAMVVSPDQKHLAAGDADGRILVYLAKTGELLHELPKHDGAVRWLTFHPERPWLASGSEDGAVRLWNYPDNSEVGRFPDGRLEPRVDPRWRHGHFDPDPKGDLFAADGTQIVRWEIDAGAEGPGRIVQTTETPWKILSLAVTRSACITGHEDVPEIRLHAHDGEVVQRLVGHSDAVRCLAIKDRDTILSGSEDGTVRLWQPEAPDSSTVHLRTSNGSSRLAWSDDGARLAIGKGLGQIQLLVPAQSSLPCVVADLESRVREVHPANRGQRVLAIDDAGNVWWAGQGSRPIKLDVKLPATVGWLDLDPLDRWLACCDQNTLYVVDLLSARIAWKHSHDGLISLAFLDSRHVITACLDGVVRVFDVATGKVVRQSSAYRSGIVWLDLSRDRRKVAIACDRTVRILDAATLVELTSIGRTNQVRQVEFFGGDDRLLVIDNERLEIVNPQTSQTLLSLMLRNEHVSINSDGKETLAISRQHTVEVIPFRSGELAKYLKANPSP